VGLRFIIFLPEVPSDVAGDAVVVVAPVPSGGENAALAAPDCACKAPFFATQKLAIVEIAFYYMASAASRRRSLVARMSRTPHIQNNLDVQTQFRR